MSENYKPGTVAVATVRGVEGLRVTRAHKAWIVTAEPEGEFPPTYSAIYDNAKDAVTDVRPLVVLDPEDMQQIKPLIRSLQRADVLDPSWDEDQTRSRVTSALRSLTRPPKPAEPTGWGAVVEDRNGHYWTLIAPESGIWANISTIRRRYDEIDAVRVVSEGVDR